MHIEVSKNLRRLLDEELYTDVAFSVGPEPTTFRAIRSILAASSPVFSAMLFGTMREGINNTKHIFEPIRLEDVTADAFRCMLQYLYGSDVVAAQSLALHNVAETLYAAEKYSLDGLKQLCLSFVDQHIADDDSHHVLRLAQDQGFTQVLEMVAEFASSVGLKEVFLSEEASIVEAKRGLTWTDIREEYEEREQNVSLQAIDHFLRTEFGNLCAVWGYECCLAAINAGEAALVVIAKDIPEVVRMELEYNAMIMKVAVHHYKGTTARLREVVTLCPTEFRKGALVFTHSAFNRFDIADTGDQLEMVVHESARIQPVSCCENALGQRHECITKRGRGVVILHGDRQGWKAVLLGVEEFNNEVTIFGPCWQDDDSTEFDAESSHASPLEVFREVIPCSQLLFTRYCYDVDGAIKSMGGNDGYSDCELITQLQKTTNQSWLFTKLGQSTESEASEMCRKRPRSN
mmetsp:Transcript_24305/g.33476  ORF Transcript_24305/g.33476 Transcript_24305/m.33476 type:complete len:461 (-) Transcript_24305:122-1504(-)|eukprot:CAMPEP_0196593186 /NCGR_PEP_ID=MMETSP1081-20130531/74927_1 /TAXON_ID=36882 /ORGANISM="Pyramimonas amylifera, Strain CCMP720" /LENGTH=460 /DNA_ID=CAMNT_0041917089 /DNA_START=133 /DNA_END=1515 /DNA_ORIENTATION=+